MKKFICVLLCVLMCAATLTLVACDKKEETLKFGMGVHISASATDATADKEGQGKATINVAVITVDAEGKVVACQIDTADNTVKYTAEGKAVANDGFKTKYELGKDYNMVTYGGAAKEWFEQADAFESVVVGKTLDEIKALVAEGGKGTDAVISAGCTIAVTEFVGAIEKAFANLADSNATASSTLKLGMNTAQSTKDATADANGQNQVETTIVAAAIDADGKVLVAASDCVQVKFTFDLTGKSTFDASAAILTKREKGDNYNMVAYGGAVAEWYAQADAFDAACVGKTASEIAGLMGEDGKAVADVQAAGCTIYVSGFVAAASKI